MDNKEKIVAKINSPKWVVLQLLEKCNLRCRMCYEWGENGAYHKKKSLAMLDYNVVSQIIKDCLPGKPFFELFGGEPLLYPKVGDVIRLIRDGGSSIDIPTNGTLIEKYAEMLIDTQPNRLWISVDGPEEINDRQRGKGVFQKAIKGIEKLHQLRQSKGSEFPKIGITYVVTSWNYSYIEEFVLSCLDLSKIDYLSVELQRYITPRQFKSYEEVLKVKFGIPSAPDAKGKIQDTAKFADIDFEAVTRQILKVRKFCSEQKTIFISHPKTIEVDNIRNYFCANWGKMVDKRTHCIFPWIFAEVSARGDVTVCDAFYDLTLGNVYEKGILEIWRGDRLKKVREYLRNNLFPICTACCRYYVNPTKF